MVRDDIHPTHQQRRIDNPVEQFHDSLGNQFRRRSLPPKIDGTMGRLRYGAAVMVRDDRPGIVLLPVRLGQIFDVITYCQDHLIADQPLLDEVQHKTVRHLLDHGPRFPEFVGRLKDLAAAQAVGRRTV